MLVGAFVVFRPEPVPVLKRLNSGSLLWHPCEVQVFKSAADMWMEVGNNTFCNFLACDCARAVRRPVFSWTYVVNNCLSTYFLLEVVVEV